MRRTQLVYAGGPLPARTRGVLLGGKAANLLRVAEAEHRVPPFYVITTHAFHQAMQSNGLAARIEHRIDAALSDEDRSLHEAARAIRGWIEQIDLSPQLGAELHAAHARTLPDAACVAVRSSVADEDASDQSFAGMHDSLLGLRGIDRILDAIKEVWASAFSHRALAYRRARGLSMKRFAAAVIVQEMIDAAAAGVMFTANPLTRSPYSLVVSAVPGIGAGLASGGSAADTYVVEKSSLEITKTELSRKSERLQLDTENGAGVTRVSISEQEQGASSLSETQIRELAEAGMAVERLFGRPQDIEFCFDDRGTLFLLQSRPITAVHEYGPAAGNPLVWDNSNIVESYSGVTSPMTFSFIRRAYSIVYYCFAEVMGIRAQTVRHNRDAFENMLGLFRGRVYYNLKNWYRLVRLFPGFRYNSRFMESMMGLKEPLQLDDERETPGLLQRWLVELPALLRLVARSLWNFVRIHGIVLRFQTEFNRHYDKWKAMDFRHQQPHHIMNLYREMEDALLWNWKAPIINDFFVMVFYGTLRKLCSEWCDDRTGSLQNDLICGEGDVESTEPLKMLLRMTRTVREQPDLADIFRTEPSETLLERASTDARFSALAELVERYLDLYGFRCVGELKLEECSLRDRPQLLYQTIKHYLAREDTSDLDPATIALRQRRIRRDAERRAFAALARYRRLVPRATIFRWVLANARRGVRNRESMRLARARIYAVLREMLHAIAEHFEREQILESSADIFYLTIDEVWDFIKGTAVTTDLRGLVNLRRAEFEPFRSEASAPANRFATYGAAYHRNCFRNHQPPTAEANGTLRGTGCCPGIVTGPARLIRDPTQESCRSGDILVAEQTDPGWTPLYPTVSGILIERGSILSHSAIVAREMAIPTIVGIAGLTHCVRSGQPLTMNGSTGTVVTLPTQGEAVTHLSR